MSKLTEIESDLDFLRKWCRGSLETIAEMTRASDRTPDAVPGRTPPPDAAGNEASSSSPKASKRRWLICEGKSRR